MSFTDFSGGARRFRDAIHTRLSRSVSILFTCTRLPGPLLSTYHCIVANRNGLMHPLLITDTFSDVGHDGTGSTFGGGSGIGKDTGGGIDGSSRDISGDVSGGTLRGDSLRSLLRGSSSCSVTHHTTLTMRLLRACSLIRSSLPYVSSSSLHHNRPATRVIFTRSATLLTNSILRALTFRMLATRLPAFTPFSSTVTDRLVTVFTPHTEHVISKRVLSLGTRTDVSVARDRLRTVRHSGANTLVRTTVLVNNVYTNTATPRHVTLRSYTRRVNLTFRIRSSVLSIAADASALNGPTNDSRGLSGSACIGLVNISSTADCTRSLFSSKHTTVSHRLGNGRRGSTLVTLVR